MKLVLTLLHFEIFCNWSTFCNRLFKLFIVNNLLMVLSYSVYAFTYNHKLFLCHTIETHDILAEGPTLAAMMKFTYIPYACCRAICCHIVHIESIIRVLAWFEIELKSTIDSHDCTFQLWSRSQINSTWTGHSKFSKCSAKPFEYIASYSIERLYEASLGKEDEIRLQILNFSHC